jgi:hypothetical protein
MVVELRFGVSVQAAVSALARLPDDDPKILNRR